MSTFITAGKEWMPKHTLALKASVLTWHIPLLLIFNDLRQVTCLWLTESNREVNCTPCLEEWETKYLWTTLRINHHNCLQQAPEKSVLATSTKQGTYLMTLSSQGFCEIYSFNKHLLMSSLNKRLAMCTGISGAVWKYQIHHLPATQAQSTLLTHFHYPKNGDNNRMDLTELIRWLERIM